jgi:flagellar export protein FliJ
MRTRDSFLRLARFKFQERQRQVQGLEAMIAEFQRKLADLDNLIASEEARSGITDPEHFNYSTAAKSARVRRDNLLSSVAELNDQLFAAQAAMKEEEDELNKLELIAGKVEPSRPISVGPSGNLIHASR